VSGLSAMTDIAGVADQWLVRRQGTVGLPIGDDVKVLISVVDFDTYVPIDSCLTRPEQTARWVAYQFGEDLLGRVGWPGHTSLLPMAQYSIPMAHYTQHGEYGIGADKILARGALE
jgi:hypothetical protein